MVKRCLLILSIVHCLIFTQDPDQLLTDANEKMAIGALSVADSLLFSAIALRTALTAVLAWDLWECLSLYLSAFWRALLIDCLLFAISLNIRWASLMILNSSVYFYLYVPLSVYLKHTAINVAQSYYVK